MPRRTKRAAGPTKLIKIGATYREEASGALVTVEDHEVRHGRRTGRVVVCAVDGRLRLPRRWYAREKDLVEPQGELSAAAGAATRRGTTP